MYAIVGAVGEVYTSILKGLEVRGEGGWVVNSGGWTHLLL